ncbi:hypothetical protein [Barnesiella sp. CU968]|uniref:hypothetical protein n=1 Tax=Barnesiella sp. CU968 TaxID=2780099 RepID=UPI00195E1D92|nr:hypothetical protein [Barnesiella sp. CU968]MBJ2197556.1 hypothetical protein [Muribaculaceae bacterium]MCI9030720.1 hypothetical protein [Muribaculaceae bacterium]
MTETRTAILTFAENRDSFRFAELLSYLNGLFEISKVTLSWYLREMVKTTLFSNLAEAYIRLTRCIHRNTRHA